MRKKRIIGILAAAAAVLAVGAFFAVQHILDADLQKQRQELEQLQNNQAETKSGQAVETQLLNFEDGAFFLKMPVSFSQMDAETIAEKYPQGNPPDYVYTNAPDTTINVAVSVTDDKMPEEAIASFLRQMEETLSGSARDIKASVGEREGHTVGEMRFVSQAVDTEIYNHILAFSQDGKLRLVAFNCTAGLQEEWRPVGDFLLSSLHFPS